MKTAVPKNSDFGTRKWFQIDAEDLILGKLATKAANIIRGKDKTCFAAHVDCGDFLIVTNAKKIKVTGNKEEQKMYYRHSGYPGGLKTKPFNKMREEKPTHIIEHAVAGMIPKNKLKKTMLKRLKVYAGTVHSHEAQQPEIIKL
ncbi:50S ribosomal protein L13 [Patescibacteria group bacterium]|nr:50S ribosomal protein L13 [Patescibacteria group bacterium]